LNILVRNLNRAVTKTELFKLFQPFGEIKSVSLVMDEATSKSKGFGFVEITDDSKAEAAIKALNGKLIQGQKIRVKKTDQREMARPRHPEAGGKRIVDKLKSGMRGAASQRTDRSGRRDKH
jgi:RNA recognition motif-containing protein